MNIYRVELRALPDTPKEEEQANKQGRALGAQTVIYHVGAASAEAAAVHAIEVEQCFLYRKKVWLFETPRLVQRA